MLKKLFFGYSFLLIVSNLNTYAESDSVINSAASQISKENKQQENSTESHNIYNSTIETITSKGKGGISSVYYSRDNSTGLCWINAVAEDVYKMNVIAPSMHFTSSTFQDKKCVYFNAAKKNL